MSSRWTAHVDQFIFAAPLTTADVRSKLVLALGIIMVLLGAWVALRPLWNPRPLTGATWLDLTFAFVFLVRGYMNIRSARRARPLYPDASH